MFTYQDDEENLGDNCSSDSAIGNSHSNNSNLECQKEIEDNNKDNQEETAEPTTTITTITQSTSTNTGSTLDTQLAILRKEMVSFTFSTHFTFQLLLKIENFV